jgi:hypothetical protein
MWPCALLFVHLLPQTQIASSQYLFINIMPKKAWATKDQISWLMSQLPEFRAAQETKAVPDFFIDLYAEFFKQWPLPAPTMEEIAEAKGEEEQAKTAKRKANESVSE